MEVVDYLRLARRRLWLIVLIPLLAAAGVLGYWHMSPSSYDATAYVFAPEALAGSGNQFSGPAGITEWISEFSATAVSPGVVRGAARASGVPAADITQGLQVAQVQQSSQLKISFSWTKRSMAESVVKHVANATPKALFAPQLAQASRALTQAQASLDAVNKDLLDASRSWGSTRPDLAYSGTLKVLIGLENARAAIKARDASARAVARVRISQARAQLATLANDVSQFQNLTARRMAATTVLARAQEALQTARTQFSDASGAVTMLPTRHSRASSDLIKSVVSAVLAGLVIALCLIAALELLRASRARSRHPVPLEGEAADHPWTADHEPSASGLVDAGAPGWDGS